MDTLTPNEWYKLRLDTERAKGELQAQLARCRAQNHDECVILWSVMLEDLDKTIADYDLIFLLNNFDESVNDGQ